MKSIKLLTLLCVFSYGVFCGTTRGVEVQPTIVQMPSSPGELFSFDLVISAGPNPLAQAFQATIDSISPSGVLTFDIPSSEAVSGEPAYWLFANSAGAAAIGSGNGPYTFGDNPNNGQAQELTVDEVVARYVFTWGGTEGDYTFTFDLDTTMSYILLEDLTSREALQLPGGGDSFTAHIPEPSTLVLLGLGCLAFLKKRRL
jgi:hypothetical protein